MPKTIKPTKLTWRYGLMKYKNGEVGVHEIYTDNSWTEQPIIVGDNLEDILEVLDMIKKDVISYPIMNYEN